MNAFKQIGRVLVGIALATSLFGCTTQSLSKPSLSEKLPVALANIGGQYIWDAQTKKYQFSDKFKLDQIVNAENKLHALHVLVSCMDDESQTKTQLDNKFVKLGVLCYQGVTQIVYYEPVDKHGDIAGIWPGYISPAASIVEMREAKKAWQRVLEKKTYIFL